MKKKICSTIRKSCLHLYNPQEEGLGSYDIHYINAYGKVNRVKEEKEQRSELNRRYAA